MTECFDKHFQQSFYKVNHILLSEYVEFIRQNSVNKMYFSEFFIGTISFVLIIDLQNRELGFSALLVGTNLSSLIFFPVSMLPESPRWLYSQGKTAEAEDVMQYIALGNGKERLNLKLKPSAGTSRKDESPPGILNLVKHPVLRWRTIVLMYIWYVITRH